jgi:hypothetical protein
MKRAHLLGGLAVLVAAAAPIVAHAGLRGLNRVSVDPAARRVTGGFGSTRNSPDATSYVYCYASASQSNVFGYCFASDAAGDYGTCFTNVPAIIETIRSLDGDSAVTFYWDTSGSCTSVSAFKGSHYEPKQP